MKSSTEGAEDESRPARSVFETYRATLLADLNISAEAQLPEVPIARQSGDKLPGSAAGGMPAGEADVVFSFCQLQRVADYRGALRSWFEAVAPSGHLVLAVPHAHLYDRRDALPARWDSEQKRLYTPASLLDEVEEALTPNTYRVRRLLDHDENYDYRWPPHKKPAGAHHLVLVLQKIAPPAWDLGSPQAGLVQKQTFQFEPQRTRLEATTDRPSASILALKLDHLGDYIMGIPALERLRQTFPDSDITLVCGSWNKDMAAASGLFDSVVVFDAFPRNPSEEKLATSEQGLAFEAAITSRYDLALDLRTDPDTRFLLKHVQALTKAGIGSRAQFPFLDIFLPIDATRQTQTVREIDIPAREFAVSRPCRSNRFVIEIDGPATERQGPAIIYGPYRELLPGHYMFEPFVDFSSDPSGLVRFDVALNQVVVDEGVIGPSLPVRPSLFFNADIGTKLEFRIWGLDEHKVPSFRFYGGRLVRKGEEEVLHQSEYLMLLVDLVAARLQKYGSLTEMGAD